MAKSAFVLGRDCWWDCCFGVTQRSYVLFKNSSSLLLLGFSRNVCRICFVYFEMGSHIAQFSLELTVQPRMHLELLMLVLLSPECWNKDADPHIWHSNYKSFFPFQNIKRKHSLFFFFVSICTCLYVQLCLKALVKARGAYGASSVTLSYRFDTRILMNLELGC